MFFLWIASNQFGNGNATVEDGTDADLVVIDDGAGGDSSQDDSYFIESAALDKLTLTVVQLMELQLEQILLKLVHLQLLLQVETLILVMQPVSMITATGRFDSDLVPSTLRS